jgi:hypothetical protein
MIYRSKVLVLRSKVDHPYDLRTQGRRMLGLNDNILLDQVYVPHRLARLIVIHFTPLSVLLNTGLLAIDLFVSWTALSTSLISILRAFTFAPRSFCATASI